MNRIERLTSLMPRRMARRVEPLLEMVAMTRQMSSVNSLAPMLPSLGRGLVLRQGRTQKSTQMVSGHAAHFDWTYRSDFPEMRQLYRRAKAQQWDSEEALDWNMDVDPLNPEKPLLPQDFLTFETLRRPPRLNTHEQRRLNHSITSWMLSQFLHGEQGALYAAAQVTESVKWMDGKLYGATQVVDEARHVETFHRYIDEKLNKLYIINDNLFVIIDALMNESRWDMKFLGMQIMVEGLALGAFSTLYQLTDEPLLKELLARVIQDEARHVHYGVLALNQHITQELTERERQEREDWAFEVAILMRNRFLAHEVYEEWFEGTMSRQAWNRLIDQSPGMQHFRTTMFKRLIPNLRAIGLLTPRMRKHYEDAGLMHFASGRNAMELSESDLMHELETGSKGPYTPSARPA
mgnify:CR=1 FL=1